jgi:hypothetical protein
MIKKGERKDMEKEYKQLFSEVMEELAEWILEKITFYRTRDKKKQEVYEIVLEKIEKLKIKYEENENTNLSRPCTICGEEDHNAVEHEIE